MIPPDRHLQIGSLAFDELDQMDLTGPFEVLACLPNSTHRIFAKTTAPVRDVHGLKLVPDAILADAPQLDVLRIPGGFGQEALMEDEDVLGWIRRQAKCAQCVFAVCAGVLICGAAGLIKGRQATTHWSAHHLLPFFGAVPINKRVVVDGNMVFAAGVTSGIDGALCVAAKLRGEGVAKSIQLDMEYAPEPPFNTGTPETAPADILDSTRHLFEPITARLEETARRIANRLGVSMPPRT
jgi:cyclohexyl-isocyanide hydratase